MEIKHLVREESAVVFEAEKGIDTKQEFQDKMRVSKFRFWQTLIVLIQLTTASSRC